MSVGIYRVCNMCRRIELDNSGRQGRFRSYVQVDGADAFDLCPECAYKVQRFIRGHGEESDDQR